MSKGENSFSKTLSKNVLLVTSLIFIAALGFTSLYSHIIVANEAEESATHLLHSTINEIEAMVGKVEEKVEGVAWLVEEKKYDEDYLYHITRKMVEEQDILGSAIAFEPYFFKDKYYFSPYSYKDEASGDIVSKQLGTAQFDYFYMDWYQIPNLLGEPCWSEPYFDEAGAGAMMTTYSYPIKDENGHTYAILTADISLDWISDMLSGIKPYPSSNVSLISRNGSYITLGTNSALLGETVFSTAIPTGNKDILKIAENIINQEEGVSKYVRNGETSFAVYGHLSNGWSVSITCALAEVLSRASMMHLITTIIAILGLIVLFFVCRITIRRLTEPLKSISDSALSIANGNFETELPEIHTGDEVQLLRDSFDYMEKSLVSYIDNLKTTTAANERFESELNIANKLQMALLPVEFPDNDKIGLHAFVKPAKEVGGDLYDFFIKDNLLYFAVGDVSGKGVPASIFMAITKSLFRFISDMDLELNEVLIRMNDFISKDNSGGMFVTMFIGCLNMDTGEMKYCNAGHNPVIVNGRFLDVKPNLAVGLMEGFPYVQQSCTLDKGSWIVAYTDGVNEAERADKEQYGNERLLAWSADMERYQNTGDACDHLYGEVKDFVAGNEQNDDITIMTIKYK